ncbi:hypothetical protein Q8A67_006283 [Cirrhinus molitorella]|uniref:FIIND domain-containing protein n=1 Tax=Cirrhinus molitorella TaxID=172907 RepID=A0AA88TTD5_9TELE|nr:hypothetical protein Q8A67_006283 [Cirrhinus molitorella]
MRWVCDCDVTLQYQTVDGQFLNAELERLQCNRIAPVMDVTVISGKLEEVHLPHYACLEESDPSLRDAVKVLSVKDEQITIEPVQLTRFHAKIVQPSFSFKTLILNRIMRLEQHCDLLLYMCPKAPLTLHVYFFPSNDDTVKENIKKKEESKSNYSIMHPRPDRPLRMNTPHILDVPGALVHPKEGITLRRERDPNFFKIKTRGRPSITTPTLIALFGPDIAVNSPSSLRSTAERVGRKRKDIEELIHEMEERESERDTQKQLKVRRGDGER